MQQISPWPQNSLPVAFEDYVDGKYFLPSETNPVVRVLHIVLFLWEYVILKPKTPQLGSLKSHFWRVQSIWHLMVLTLQCPSWWDEVNWVVCSGWLPELWVACCSARSLPELLPLPPTTNCHRPKVLKKTNIWSKKVPKINRGFACHQLQSVTS